jgi:hypothetical protein
VDLVDVGREEIADGAQHDVLLAVDQRRPALVAGGVLHAVPEAEQVVEVIGELAGLLVEPRGGAHDQAEALRRVEIRHQLAQPLAFLALDAPRDAGLVRAGQEHQVAAGKRVERGERRRLVGELLLGDLHQDLAAGLEQVADAAALLLAVLVDRLRRGVGQVAEADFVERQERVALGADVDERRLERGMDAVDDAFVDVAFEVFAAEGLDLKRFEDPVVDDAHSALFRVGDVDEHQFRHSNSSRRGTRRVRTARGRESRARRAPPMNGRRASHSLQPQQRHRRIERRQGPLVERTEIVDEIGNGRAEVEAEQDRRVSRRFG